MGDVVHDLAHDHGEINRLVLTAASALRASNDESRGLVHDSLVQLRDALFLHFALEEETLFPFVTTIAPDLEPKIDALLVAHDAICGLIARLLYTSGTHASPSTGLIVIFERFQASYAEHALAESAFLSQLDRRLDPAQRDRLAALAAAF